MGTALIFQVDRLLRSIKCILEWHVMENAGGEVAISNQRSILCVSSSHGLHWPAEVFEMDGPYILCSKSPASVLFQRENFGRPRFLLERSITVKGEHDPSARGQDARKKYCSNHVQLSHLRSLKGLHLLQSITMDDIQFHADEWLLTEMERLNWFERGTIAAWSKVIMRTWYKTLLPSLTLDVPYDRSMSLNYVHALPKKTNQTQSLFPMQMILVLSHAFCSSLFCSPSPGPSSAPFRDLGMCSPRYHLLRCYGHMMLLDEVLSPGDQCWRVLTSKSRERDSRFGETLN